MKISQYKCIALCFMLSVVLASGATALADVFYIQYSGAGFSASIWVTAIPIGPGVGQIQTYGFGGSETYGGNTYAVTSIANPCDNTDSSGCSHSYTTDNLLYVPAQTTGTNPGPSYFSNGGPADFSNNGVPDVNGSDPDGFAFYTSDGNLHNPYYCNVGDFNGSGGCATGNYYEYGTFNTLAGGGGALIYNSAPAIANTPEPESLVLFGAGLIGFAGIARKKLGRTSA